jgi:hypothetical protein
MISSLVGIIASSGAGVAGGDYESIATVTVGSGGSASITFSSIPSTYQHLQIRGIARSTATGDSTGQYYAFRFNSDTGNNYSFHVMKGDGSSVSASAIAPWDTMAVERTSTAFQTAGVFGAIVLDVLDYADTNKYKTTRALAGFDNNGSGQIALCSDSWRNTAAVDNIVFTLGAGNFAEYSSFALYGIKG